MREASSNTPGKAIAMVKAEPCEGQQGDHPRQVITSVVAGSGGDRVGSTRLLLLLWFRLKGEQLFVELMVEQEDLAVHQMVAHSPR
jgi:hypothetical protein